MASSFGKLFPFEKGDTWGVRVPIQVKSPPPPFAKGGKRSRDRIHLPARARGAYFGLLGVLLAVVVIPIHAGQPSGFFLKNIGQVDPKVLYYADGPQGRIWVEKDAIVFQAIEPLGPEAGRSLSLDDRRGLEGLNSLDADCKEVPPRRIVNVYVRFPQVASIEAEAEEPLQTRVHYFKGRDPAGWRTDVPACARVRVRDIGPGFDLVLDGERRHGTPWYLERTGPAASLLELRMAIDSKEEWQAGPGGISLKAPWGRIQVPNPVLAESDSCIRRLKVLPGGTLAPEASDFGLETLETPALTSQPPQELVWATFFGTDMAFYGNEFRALFSLAQASDGAIIFASTTRSSDLPVPGGYDQSFNADWDFYVAAISPDGSTLLWATYLGGSGSDLLYATRVASDGGILVGGVTGSSDIPVPDGYNAAEIGGGYVAKLSRDGSHLIWGTYVRSLGLYTLALDREENVIVAGNGGPQASTPGGYTQTCERGGIYAAKISSNGDSLLWGTFLCGSIYARVDSVVLDAGDNILLGCSADYGDLPVLNAYDPTFNGPYRDIYIAKLTHDGSNLLFATYLGGSGGEHCSAIALDGNGDIVVGGQTDSYEIPTTPDAFERWKTTLDDQYGVKSVFYVAKLSSSGSDLLWGTYVCGLHGAHLYDMSLDTQGNVLLAGNSGCCMPTPNGFQSEPSPVTPTIYLAKLASSGKELLWGTYIAGDPQSGTAKVILPAGPEKVLCAASAEGPGLPTPGGFNPTYENACLYLAELSDPAPSECSLWCYTEVPALSGVNKENNFIADATATLCGEKPTFRWDFGDGESSMQMWVQHMYPSGGDYAWTLTASAGGKECVRTGAISVCEYSCSGTTQIAAKPMTVSFSASFPTLGCGEIWPNYGWSFGNGSGVTVPSPDFSYTYPSPGTYMWHLWVDANNGVIQLLCESEGTVSVSALPGDCNGNGEVSIGEVQKTVNMFLGLVPPACGADCDANGAISIGEVQKVINAFLGLEVSC